MKKKFDENAGNLTHAFAPPAMHHNYSSLEETHEQDEETGGPLVHVAEPSRARWNHIHDLDSFFTRMYQYHQRNGFFFMLMNEVLDLGKFVFMIIITVYLLHGIDYPVLFKEIPPPHNGTKVTLSDVLYSPSECISHFRALTWMAVVLATIWWIVKLLRGVYQMFHFWDIKQFYNVALKVEDRDLGNLTWSAVQTKARNAQKEQQMCIHKRDLSELDIYHRILRQENYLVAMVNKRLLPPRINVPFLGEVVYWSAGLRLNMELLLFWSPWAPFEHSWQLREEYKKPSMPNLRQELAQAFGRQILWLALVNLLFAPVIFIWQILYVFFSYAALFKREPSILATRRWSMYGRLYLRHFNELDHELNARLTRAYRHANKYLSAFVSPLNTMISENIGFYVTSILAVLVALTMIDEDVLTVEYVLTAMTILGVLVMLLRKLAPDDTMSQDLEDLLTRVMYHTHYMPPQWIGQAHTNRVRKELEQLFQYGFANLLETILSPILTPFFLWWYVYPRSLDFVDFLRSFTFTVTGVGDVCSFALMNVRTNGNPEWQETDRVAAAQKPKEFEPAAEQHTQAENGKLEMSLMHFKSTNPDWNGTDSVADYVRHVQDQTNSMIASLSNQDRPLDDSSSMHGGVWRIGEPLANNVNIQGLDDFPSYTSSMWRAVRAESVEEQPHMSRMWTREGVSPNSVVEMALSAAYLHQVNSARTENRSRNTAQETTPLLIHR